MKNYILHRIPVIALLATLSLPAANAEQTVTITNVTNCTCTGMFPDYSGCKIVPANAKPVQAMDANRSAYGSQIVLGATGLAPIFKQQVSNYNTVEVDIDSMPTTFIGAKPGAHFYVIATSLMDGFALYALNSRNPCY